MKKHTKLYLIAVYGDITNEFKPCEVCGQAAVDIHHIMARGMGGSKNNDHIENLMGLCRQDHVKYGDKTEFIPFLLQTHQQFLDFYGVDYNANWFLEMKNKYS